MTQQSSNQPGSPRDALRATGLALMRADFADAAVAAEQGLAELDIARDGALWRELTFYHCVAIRYQGRIDDAMQGLLSVRDSARADGDHLALLRARAAISVLIFHSGRHDEALREIDAVLAMAESPIATGGARIESYMLAGTAASQIGLTAIGDSLMQMAADGVAAGHGAGLPDSLLLSLRGGHVHISSQQAMALECTGDAAAEDRFECVLLLCDEAELLFPQMPQKPALLFRAYRSMALAALGRTVEAVETLQALQPPPNGYGLDILGQLTELAAGFAMTRTGRFPPGCDPVAFCRQLVTLAEKSEYPQQQAEALRHLAQVARATGRPAVAASAAERFEGVLSQLDWTARLRRAEAGQFSSAMLAELARRS